MHRNRFMAVMFYALTLLVAFVGEAISEEYPVVALILGLLGIAFIVIGYAYEKGPNDTDKTKQDG